MSTTASTIASISTPSGIGGIAVLRLSGPEAFNIAARHVNLPAPDKTTRFSPFRNGDTLIDEVVVTLFRSPTPTQGKTPSKSPATAPSTSSRQSSRHFSIVVPDLPNPANSPVAPSSTAASISPKPKP